MILSPIFSCSQAGVFMIATVRQEVASCAVKRSGADTAPLMTEALGADGVASQEFLRQRKQKDDEQAGDDGIPGGRSGPARPEHRDARAPGHAQRQVASKN